MNENDMPQMIPYVVHESEVARMERIIKRLFIICILLIIVAVGTNAYWIYYESQWEDEVITQEIQQDSGEGGAVTPIAVAIVLAGEQRPTSRAIYTPTAVETYGNVTSTAIVKIPRGCCFSLSVEYVSGTDDPTVTPTPLISVINSNLTITRIA